MPEVYASLLDLKPLKGVEATEAFLSAVKDWVGGRAPAVAAGLALSEPAGARGDDGSVFRWEPFIDSTGTLLEFTWRHPHVDDPTIAWTTQAAMYDHGEVLRLMLRVSNTGPELGQPHGLPTTRPRLVLALLDHFQVQARGYPCRLEPRAISEREFPDFVRYELFDTTREHPLLVLAPQRDGTYVVPPAQLAREFLTLGELVVAETPGSTFALTRELRSRTLSCFHGALRVYLPGLSYDADPYRHPLLTPRHLDAALNRLRLAQFLAARTVFRFKVEDRFNQLRDERGVRAAEQRSKLTDQLAAALAGQADAAVWQALAEQYAHDNRRLLEEKRELADSLKDKEEKLKAARYALSQKGHEAQDVVDDEPEFIPSSVLEAVEYAEGLFPEIVRILPSALRSAEDSPYDRPDEVWRALRAIESVATRMAAGPLGKNLSDVFAEMGFSFAQGLSPHSPDKVRRQYRFQDGPVTRQCEAHLQLGAGTYDPAYCLRIYFTTDADPPAQIIIGHVGRHLDVISTT